MAKQELPLFANPLSSQPTLVTSPLTVIGTLRQAINLPSRNGKLMRRVILLILTPFSLLVLLHYFIAGPLCRKVEDGYENSSLDPKDVRSLVGIELVFFTAFWFVCFFGMMLTMCASASTYIGKQVGVNDLLLWFKFTWKKPFITWLIVSILTVIYIGLLILMIKLVNLVGTTTEAYVSSWVMGIFAVFFYLYLAARWTLALVISVVEDDSHGVKALGKAHQLIRGRKLQGFLLMFILVAASMPLYILFYVTATDDDDELGPFTQFAFGFSATVLVCLAKFFTYVVFTLFYYVCKSHREEEAERELGPAYSLVHESQVDTSLY